MKIQKLISGGVLITAGGLDFFFKKISEEKGGGRTFIRDLRVLNIICNKSDASSNILENWSTFNFFLNFQRQSIYWPCLNFLPQGKMLRCRVWGFRVSSYYGTNAWEYGPEILRLRIIFTQWCLVWAKFKTLFWVLPQSLLFSGIFEQIRESVKGLQSWKKHLIRDCSFSTCAHVRVRIRG